MLRSSALGIAALLMALVWLAAPQGTRAQWAESFGLGCPGQWVAGGTMCLCPDGQYAAYINGQVTCPGGGQGIGGGGYQGDPCGWGSCNPGSYCGEPGVCVPNGQTYCGGGQSCPAGTKCSTGGCLPQEATDCGDGSYCPGGTLCWQDPPDDTRFYGGSTQCLGVEEYADRTESLRREREENSPEAKARRAEAERKTKARTDAEKREIGAEKKKAAAEGRELETDRKAQEQRLLSSPADRKAGASDKTAAEIMRELREDSLLDRLNETPPGQPTTSIPRQPAPAAAVGTSGTAAATAPSGFPSRQTPAPPKVDTAGRETRRLADRVPEPAPQPAMATAPPTQSQGPGPTWVQNFAATGQVDPAKMPPAARKDYYERLKREAAAAAQAQRAKNLEAERAYYENYRWDGGSNARISERLEREAAEAARAKEIAKAISEREKREAAEGEWEKRQRRTAFGVL